MQLNSYTSAEYFRNLIISNNSVVNAGFFAIVVHAASNAFIENNKVRNTQATLQIGVAAEGEIAAGDGVATNVVIRNNIVCLTQPSGGSAAVRITAPATGTESGTIYQTGALASTGACAF